MRGGLGAGGLGGAGGKGAGLLEAGVLNAARWGWNGLVRISAGSCVPARLQLGPAAVARGSNTSRIPCRTFACCLPFPPTPQTDAARARSPARPPQVRELVEGALTCAMDVIATNRPQHDGLSAELLKDERVEGEPLAAWFGGVRVPDSLREFVLEGRLPDREALGLGLLAPSSLLAEAGYGAGGRADGGLSLIRGGRRGVVDVEVERSEGPGAAAMLQAWQE